jgi:hypothetical protein
MHNYKPRRMKMLKEEKIKLNEDRYRKKKLWQKVINAMEV